MTDARTEILARVREALAGSTVELPETSAPRDLAPVATPEVVELFAERVADYRAVVERCGTEELEERIAAALPAGEVVVPPGLSIGVAGAIVDNGALTAAELDQIAAVVTEARVGIAETGTIVLDHTPDQGRRAISLVPDTHICIIREDQLVADVPDAIALLDPARPQTWISGPSATSDIELDRVEGVHGPRTLHVLITPPRKVTS
ncbi:LutC/YkgG family protein [Nocardioides albus]|uniref:L-lactate dehydrogenase complex protein LldG n=1 Tax=Nocardioides albus TaxID=1841 RepID=A0A7W5FA32_9ACTN|nr:LUD domain-containing protein [Nocardioides albus]MBB3090805.1 L-lactate dehydrogenase complex protein LldG [Nocardioides albus]GGU37579.1 hypothetical protein GCM10007979_40800 [Nocardioides albus]